MSWFHYLTSKVEDALRLRQMKSSILKKWRQEMQASKIVSTSFDTVSAKHEYQQLTSYYWDRTLISTQVGVPPEEPLLLSVGSLIFGAYSLSGSLIGSIKGWEVLVSAASITLLPMNLSPSKNQWSLRSPRQSDVKYRFVIDMASLKRNCIGDPLVRKIEALFLITK
jgi:D-arabinose 1-dehydrogenase-like Zn-dependent alcohol dehydrogenase